jgi:hypothetical protein
MLCASGLGSQMFSNRSRRPSGMELALSVGRPVGLGPMERKLL